MKVTNLKDTYRKLNETYSQGEVILVNAPKTNPNGCTQGIHPAVIVSNNRANKYAPCLTVALITSKVKRLDLPFHMEVQLAKPSMIMCEQMTTISKQDVIERVCMLNSAKQKELKKCLKKFLDI